MLQRLLQLSKEIVWQQTKSNICKSISFLLQVRMEVGAMEALKALGWVEEEETDSLVVPKGKQFTMAQVGDVNDETLLHALGQCHLVGWWAVRCRFAVVAGSGRCIP